MVNRGQIIKFAILLSLSIILMLVFISSCSPGKVPVSPGSQTLAPQPAPGTTLSGWEQQWVKLQDTGKKEGTAVIYTSSFGDPKDLSNAFKKNYNIDLQFTAGKGDEIAQKILTERRAGLYIPDAYIGGATSVINFVKPSGAMEPLKPALILPEVTDGKFWNGGDLRWIDKDQQLLSFIEFVEQFIGINTTQAKADELKSYKDLLNPKWKGKIVINDPTVTGIGEKFTIVVGGKIMGFDYIRELAKQQPVIIRDQRLQVEWLAQGKYPIAICPKTDVFTEFLKAGAPIEYVMPVEGTSTVAGSGNVYLFKNAPHPSAARVFINWLLTKEGQTIFSRTYGAPSARVDVSTEGFVPSMLVKPGIKYIQDDAEEMLLKAPDVRKISVEIFGPLMK